MRKNVKRYLKVLVLALAVIFFLAGMQAKKSHFAYGTSINGTDVSWLSVTGAADKLTDEFGQKIVFTVITSEGKSVRYVFNANSLEAVQLQASAEVIQEALAMQQENRHQHEFEFLNLFTIDEDELRASLSIILNGEVSSQDAYLIINDEGLIDVVPEIIYDYVELDEAVEFAEYLIARGSYDIDFSFIAKSTVDVTADDLTETAEKLNKVLSTSIDFVLSDGSIVTLDSDTMKNWIEVDSENNYTINIQDNVTEFVASLAEEVASKTQIVAFQATDEELQLITLDGDYRVSLDQEAMAEKIMQCLETGGTYTLEPVYTGTLVSNLLSSYEAINVGAEHYWLSTTGTYVELDISRQTVWLYINGECLLETPCVTGNVSKDYSTPTGLYFLTYKTTDVTLKGKNADGSEYASPVKYWMPFNGGIGFHDASWRSSFGGEIYQTNGSHGCVNLPTSKAEILYENIDKTIPIIVYESESEAEAGS